MREAVIVTTARTPIGRAFRGALNNIKSPTLMAHAIRHAVQRAGVEGAEIEDVVIGTVLTAGTAGMNIARNAAFAAGLPVTVGGTNHRPPVRVRADRHRGGRETDRRRRPGHRRRRRPGQHLRRPEAIPGMGRRGARSERDQQGGARLHADAPHRRERRAQVTGSIAPRRMPMRCRRSSARPAARARDASTPRSCRSRPRWRSSTRRPTRSRTRK